MTRSPEDFRAIVDDYIREYRDRAARGMRFYAIQRSLADAVDVAARCVKPNGKRHDHQYRIPSESLDEARARLLAVDLGSCRSFDELHATINATIRDIHMIGALVVYDVSHRSRSNLTEGRTSSVRVRRIHGPEWRRVRIVGGGGLSARRLRPALGRQPSPRA